MNELKEIGKKETMTSKEIAEVTGKQHSHVMRDIRNTIEQINKQLNPDVDSVDKSEYHRGDRTQYKFLSESTINVFMKWATSSTVSEYLIESGSYKDASGKENSMYILNKKACYLLASGYDPLLRAKIIDRWEELENQLSQSQPSYMIDDPIKRAEQWIIEQKEKQLLEVKIEQQKPLVEFAESVSNSVNSISVGDFAKLLYDEDIKVGRNRLFDWFRKNKYLQKDKIPYQKYINSGYFEVIEQTYKTPYGNKTGFKTLITGKGQIYFTETLRKQY